jgi:nucleotide-binding universal stress UspA family protein
MNIREIVFPTDFSPASEAAGRMAREMALAARARLHFVHVVPPVTDPGPAGPLLSREAARLGTGLATDSALLHGRPAHEIITYARGRGANLIVMGTHGRTGLTRRLLGSVAEAVVRTSHCPVLTVPMTYTPDAPVTASVPAPGAPDEAVERCIVCRKKTDDLVCEECRALIRGEPFKREMNVEPAGLWKASA